MNYSFGDIYIGETFRAYVAIVNTSDYSALNNVSVALHLLGMYVRCVVSVVSVV